MIIAPRKAAVGLVALGASTLAVAAPAVASNSGTQPKGPPLFSGNPASIANTHLTGNGAFVLHCISPADGGSAGVFLVNKNGTHNNNPGASC